MDTDTNSKATILVAPTRVADPAWIYHSARLVQAGSRTMFSSNNRNRMPMFGMFDQFKSRSSLLAVALIDNTIVGTASLKYLSNESSFALFRRTTLYSSWLLENCFNAVELGYISVDQKHRNKDIATNLCQSLINSTLEKRLFATVHVDNAASNELMLKLGFIPVGKSYVSRVTGNHIKAYRWNRT